MVENLIKRLLATVIAGFSVPAMAIPLLVNGSFEDPVTPSGAPYLNFRTNNVPIIGTGSGDQWTVRYDSGNPFAGGGAAVIPNSYHTSDIYYPTPRGNQFLQVAANPADLVIISQILPTQPTYGGHYRLSFYQSDVRRGTGGKVAFDLVYFVNNAQIYGPVEFTTGANSDWALQTREFDLADGVGRPALRILQKQGYPSLVDDVALEFTPLGSTPPSQGLPEPGTLLLSLLGLGWLGASRRRSH